jgi:WD40 repeat protein
MTVDGIGNDEITAVAFSPDGKLLATADSSGMVQLWDLATSKALGSPVPAYNGPDSGLQGIAFSPDGKLLATVGDNGVADLWPVTIFSNQYTALCTDVGPPTLQEWKLYAAGEPPPPQACK